MIYLLEDDESIRTLIAYTLEHSGLPTRGFALPSEFWSAMDSALPQLLLLDIMLPEEDGLTILARLRKQPQTARLPVILLTAKGTEYDKVLGLDTGADDYITKPFGMMELLSRVRALLRRTAGADDDPPAFTHGCLYVCPARHEVRVNGEEIALTLKEFKLLCLLLQKHGAVADREEILRQIWGYAYDGESRTVDVHVRTLRQKLGAAGAYVETVKGIGYKIGGVS